MGIKRSTLALLVSLVAFAAYGQDANNVQGHEYVDLGLSVYWATCNIGSDSPEGYGDYFAWGETYPKACYNKMTYRYFGETTELWDYTKYKGDGDPHNPDNSKLLPEDDAAIQNWGMPWRMPTKHDFYELLDNCYWEPGSINNVKGCWAVSKINGNKVFFPLAGYYHAGYILKSVGECGAYWSSELRPDMCFEAYELWISPPKSQYWISDDGLRETGQSVRAVCDK